MGGESGALNRLYGGSADVFLHVPGEKPRGPA